MTTFTGITEKLLTGTLKLQYKQNQITKTV